MFDRARPPYGKNIKRKIKDLDENASAADTMQTAEGPEEDVPMDEDGEIPGGVARQARAWQAGVEQTEAAVRRVRSRPGGPRWQDGPQGPDEGGVQCRAARLGIRAGCGPDDGGWHMERLKAGRDPFTADEDERW